MIGPLSRTTACLLVAGACLGSTPAPGQVRLAVLAGGFSAPLFATHAPGDPARVYVVEQGSLGTGRLKSYNRLTGATATVLTLSDLRTGGERGFLGLAFHPDYPVSPYIYLYTSVSRAGTTGDHDTLIRRFTMINPDLADAGSQFNIARFNQDFSNHNGGWMGFGPDGYLYIGSGDGGSGGDPNNRAQDLGSPLGKMLRIDVNSDDFPADANRNYRIPASNPFVGQAGVFEEIWAYGLRNPWRCSFDRETGDLYMGDVGQNAIEEVDYQHTSSAGGENYGWRVLEGTTCYDNTQTGGNPPCSEPGLVPPVVQYGHGSLAHQGNSITGGYVYRGPSPSLQGIYFYGDYVNDRVWSLRVDRDTGLFIAGTYTDWTTTLNSSLGITLTSITSFGEDFEGNLLIVTGGGTVYTVLAEPGPAYVLSPVVSNQTVCITVSDLTQGTTNTVERSFEIEDTNAWQDVGSFDTGLGITNWCDTVTGNPDRVFYRIQSRD